MTEETILDLEKRDEEFSGLRPKKINSFIGQEKIKDNSKPPQYKYKGKAC